MADTYEIKDSGNEQVDGTYIVSKNLWSLKEVTTLTIEGVVYTLRDASKVSLPLTEGTDGQVLAKKGDGTEWITVTLTETDPTVPAWAKEATKPSYTYSEISNTPDLSVYATKQDIVTLYKPKGSVATEQLLPSSNNTVGDVYHVEDTGAEYVYTESGWEYLGEKIDLSAYAKKSDVPSVDGLASEKYVAEAMNQVDYTAWEVYPTTSNKAVGAYKRTFIIEGEEVTFSNKKAIPANATEFIKIFTSSPAAQSDVVVDWGDGSQSIIANGDYDNVAYEDNGETVFNLRHTYEEEGFFIVKVYGKGYWKISHPTINSMSLMSRVFADDLPIASHLSNMSAFCAYTNKLLYVDVPPYHRIVYAANLSYLFTHAKNLQRVTGFKRMYNAYNVSGMFCENQFLKYTDFRFSPDIYVADTIFQSCGQLTVDINKMFQNQDGGYLDFKNSYVKLYRAFINCASLTGTISDNLKSILWGSSKTTFNSTETFTNAANLISQVPVSWGGRNTNIVPAKLIEDQVSSLTAQVTDIDTALTEVQEVLGTLNTDLDEVLTELE